tara:strand:- start:223 stop:507 length:285 start_codon:yes stop_codon:yes gene_type:complete
MRITKRQLRRIIKEERMRLLNESSGNHTIPSMREDLNEILSTIREISTDLAQGNHETPDMEGFTPEQGELLADFLDEAIEVINPILTQLDDMST